MLAICMVLNEVIVRTHKFPDFYPSYFMWCVFQSHVPYSLRPSCHVSDDVTYWYRSSCCVSGDVPYWQSPVSLWRQ